MKKAKVTFEYKAQEEDELSLAIGDVITEIENADTGWCKGLLNGKRGMFPDNFVQIYEEEDKKAPVPPSANKKPSKKKNVKRMKVLFPYAAENADEISLEVGDIIEILKDVEDGWAEGINRGKKGVFPTNFGEVIEASSESEESGDGGLEAKTEEPEPKNEELMSNSSQKKVKGIGFGNIFGEGPIKLRQRSIGEADRKKNLSTAATSKPAVTKEIVKEVHKPKKVLDYCKVTFDYGKENEDELGLTKGEIVVVLNKSPGDDGWWEGEKLDENGKKIKGLFPDNFVTALTSEEAREHEKKLQNKTESDTSKEVKSSVKTPSKEMKKSSSSIPALPSQGMKPALTNDIGVVNDSAEIAFDEPKTTEHTLNHVKRPGGPKNRRKPDATGRREKAAATEIPEEIPPSVESEEEEKVVKSPEASIKKDSTKRGVGVAVLPGLGPGGETATGETPSWLQNLKNRQSVKRPPPPTPASKEQSPEGANTPSWLANLKKRQSSEFPNATARSKSPERVSPPKEKAALQPQAADKPKPVAERAKSTEKAPNGHAAILPPSRPPATKSVAAKPTPRPSPPSPTEKPLAAWQIERQQKTKKIKDSNEDKAPEPPAVSSASGEPALKNASLPRKSPTVTKPPTEPQSLVTAPTPSAAKPDKPPVVAPVPTPLKGARAKPPPPKSKPSPAAKPASSTAVEELRTEMKNMKKEMDKIRDEMKKEILRLNSELQNERNLRISLQEEVRKLQQESAS